MGATCAACACAGSGALTGGNGSAGGLGVAAVGFVMSGALFR